MKPMIFNRPPYEIIVMTIKHIHPQSLITVFLFVIESFSVEILAKDYTIQNTLC